MGLSMFKSLRDEFDVLTEEGKDISMEISGDLSLIFKKYEALGISFSDIGHIICYETTNIEATHRLLNGVKRLQAKSKLKPAQ
jgi:hypothetical protein